MIGFQFATVGLGPVLLAQGSYVRRVTPRLPEPAGPRQGVDGTGPDLRLLILGDSAAAGVGVANQAEALSGQLVAALAPHFRVRWKLLAQTGLTTQEVLAQLEASPQEPFDVVVTSAGVNDATGRTPFGQWRQVQQQLIEVLLSRHQARHVLLSSLPPMQAFPALPQPLRWYLGLSARRFNRGLYELAATRGGPCEFVDINFPIRMDFMASDGFHPGAPAYAVWARQLAAAIRQRWAAGDAATMEQ